MLVWFSYINASHADQSATTLQLPLSQSEYVWIAERIYQNECASNPENLLFWSPNEPFPSLGIGHFIWLPPDVSVPFEPAFPQFIDFLKTYYPKKSLPIRLPDHAHAPWQSRAIFTAKKESGDLTLMQIWFEKEFAVQAKFIAYRFEQQFAEVITRFPESQKNNLLLFLKSLKSSSQGQFALIDYGNFKGFGINPKEQYQGQGWGLLQVLQRAVTQLGQDRLNPFELSDQQAVEIFIDAAKQTLQQRVDLAAKELPPKDETRWLTGWFKRINGYR